MCDETLGKGLSVGSGLDEASGADDVRPSAGDPDAATATEGEEAQPGGRVTQKRGWPGTELPNRPR
jgi:hypothetical protein